MSYIYLAGPYSGTEEEMNYRYEKMMMVTSKILKDNVVIFSPIVHCHQLAKVYDLPKDFKFWENYNFTMLEKANQLSILTLDGWAESKGVKAETKFAHKNNIFTNYLDLTKVLEYYND